MAAIAPLLAVTSSGLYASANLRGAGLCHRKHIGNAMLNSALQARCRGKLRRFCKVATASLHLSRPAWVISLGVARRSVQVRSPPG